MRKWVTRMREKHVDDVSRTHTYIQKYSDFLVYTISVGLAQARPNYKGMLETSAHATIILYSLDPPCIHYCTCMLIYLT